MEIKGDAKEIADLLKLAGMDSGAPEAELDKVDAEDEMPMDDCGCSCDDTMDFLDVPVEVEMDDEEDELPEADLNNGYGDHHFADPEDYFPNGHTGPVDDEAGPASAKHGDNPLHKAMKEDSVDWNDPMNVEWAVNVVTSGIESLENKVHKATEMMDQFERDGMSVEDVAFKLVKEYDLQLHGDGAPDGGFYADDKELLMAMSKMYRSKYMTESIHKDLVYKYREFKKK